MPLVPPTPEQRRRNARNDNYVYRVRLVAGDRTYVTDLAFTLDKLNQAIARNEDADEIDEVVVERADWPEELKGSDAWERVR